MTIEDFATMLSAAIADKVEEARVQTYEEAGMLTSFGNQRGLVVKMGKDEFQVTISWSKGTDS